MWESLKRNKIFTKKKKEIPFLSPTVKASLLRGDSVACRRLALKSVRDLKWANPFLSVLRAKTGKNDK